jgi:hypothetical protein
MIGSVAPVEVMTMSAEMSCDSRSASGTPRPENSAASLPAFPTSRLQTSSALGFNAAKPRSAMTAILPAPMHRTVLSSK